jgi:hypothetical protein
MRATAWIFYLILLTGCSTLASGPVVVDSEDTLIDCFYIGTVDKIGESIAACKKAAQMSAREVHATHMMWVEAIPEKENRPAYVKGRLYKCN